MGRDANGFDNAIARGVQGNKARGRYTLDGTNAMGLCPIEDTLER